MPPSVVVVVKSILAAAELCSIEGSAAVCMGLFQPWNQMCCSNAHAAVHTHTHLKKKK